MLCLLIVSWAESLAKAKREREVERERERERERVKRDEEEARKLAQLEKQQEEEKKRREEEDAKLALLLSAGGELPAVPVEPAPAPAMSDEEYARKLQAELSMHALSCRDGDPWLCSGLAAAAERGPSPAPSASAAPAPFLSPAKPPLPSPAPSPRKLQGTPHKAAVDEQLKAYRERMARKAEYVCLCVLS